MKRLSCDFTVILLYSCACSFAAPDWGTYQANPAHTGYVAVTLDTSRFALRWEKSVSPNHSGLNPVAAGDGKVFVSMLSRFQDNTHFAALSSADGSTLWTKGFGDASSVNPPAYSNGKVYIQTGQGLGDTPPLLRAFDAVNGQLQFQSQFGAQWENYYAPTVVDGVVYVNGGYYGGMYAFDGTTGLQKWFLSLNQYDEWTPAVDAQYAYAYTGENNPGVSIVDRSLGTQSSFIPDPNFDWNGWSMNLAPVLGGQNDLIAIQAGRLLSFDLAGKQIRYELPQNFAGQVSVANGVLYAFSSGALTARDQASGSLLWTWAANASLQGDILVTNNLAFVRTQNSTYAVDLSSHQQVWTYAKAGPLAWSEDVLYIARSDGVLTAIDAPSGPPDCNHNGLDDAVDINSGSSHDCDHNHVPDECQKISNNCPFPLLDVNNDGGVDRNDLLFFTLAYLDLNDCGCSHAAADVNGDGNVDQADIVPFIAALHCSMGISDRDLRIPREPEAQLLHAARTLDVDLDLGGLLWGRHTDRTRKNRNR